MEIKIKWIKRKQTTHENTYNDDNTNTFYTFRCPQSLEMIRLYLYKKCKLERDITLCGDNWLYEEASFEKIRVLAEFSEKTMMSMFTHHQNQV